ncbi:hypothetical protein WJX84_010886 [Apatococcus fuscideae]|uniref:ACB domain-containing protein n=1 Tax=Apatococcus fuscideae TaxID=2026836 RepID=A0AAW1T4P0_9CHLO
MLESSAKLRIEESFKKAAEEAKSLPSNVTNEDKLILYGLYKQATMGDNTGDRPGVFNQTGRAKHDAWEAQKGKGKDTAMEEYIMKVQTLQEKYAS